MFMVWYLPQHWLISIVFPCFPDKTASLIKIGLWDSVAQWGVDAHVSSSCIVGAILVLKSPFLLKDFVGFEYMLNSSDSFLCQWGWAEQQLHFCVAMAHKREKNRVHDARFFPLYLFFPYTCLWLVVKFMRMPEVIQQRPPLSCVIHQQVSRTDRGRPAETFPW